MVLSDISALIRTLITSATIGGHLVPLLLLLLLLLLRTKPPRYSSTPVLPSWYAVQFHLGPIPVNVWGLFVAAGFLVGTWLAARWAPRNGLRSKDVVDFAVWAIVAGMVGARIGHVVFYEPAYFLAHPWEVFRIWEGGLSSFGGFAGAIGAAVWFARTRRLRLLRFADTLAIPLAIGWFIGRFGCYSTHLHPGIPCTRYLCVPFPDGTRRLDMGLLDGFLALGIVLIVSVLPKHHLAYPGTRTALVAMLYGFGRFTLDILRVGDAQYGWFTPAQYGSMALVAVSVVLLWNHPRYNG